MSRSHGFAQTKTDRTKNKEKTKQRTERKQRPKQRTDRKERNGKPLGAERGLTRKARKRNASIPMPFPPSWPQMLRFFLFHSFWVAMWALPPIARCAIPKVQSFLNFILLACNHHYKGRSAKCAKIGGSRIRVFDLCPIVSRSQGFAQTKTDRTKKEEKTKQRTETKRDQNKRHTRRNGKPLGAERGLTRKARKRDASIPMPFPQLSSNASLFPVPSVLGCDVGASTHSSVCNPKNTKFFEFHTSGMKPPL